MPTAATFSTRIFFAAVCFLFSSPDLPAQSSRLSPFALAPEWHSLDRYQYSLTRESFERTLSHRYSTDGAFLRYCRISDDRLTVFHDLDHEESLWTLHFSSSEKSLSHPLESRSFSNPARPLENLTIALDPGHIGGAWAKAEERWFKIGDDPPVMEWDLNLLTCQLMEPLLREAGARVVYTKKEPRPVMPRKAEDYWNESLRNLFLERHGSLEFIADPAILLERVRRRSDLFFYRTAEIAGRAEVVNRILKPDLTLCIHYNAAAWGDPANPQLVDKSRLVLFTHGAYLPDELRYEDMKFHLLRKILENSGRAEEDLAVSISRAYQRVWPQWGPENYTGTNTIRSHYDPFVYARNLIANRLFDGPVIFAEGPYMNARDAYPRLIAGDYEGERLFDGTSYRSLFREYAEAVAEGVIAYFRAAASQVSSGQ